MILSTAGDTTHPADETIRHTPHTIRFHMTRDETYGGGNDRLRQRTGVRCSLLPLVALLLTALPLGLQPSVAFAAPTCFGKPATHVTQKGDPLYQGTSGDDVVVGSSGPDHIDLNPLGGTDLVCGGGGDDNIAVVGIDSRADGGPGKDQVYAYGGALAQGGSGDDVVVYAEGPGGRAEGGSGSDVVQVRNGATADGGSGNDDVYGDLAAALYGGSGSDTVLNGTGTTTTRIDCGAAYDLVDKNGATDVRRCEGKAEAG